MVDEGFATVEKDVGGTGVEELFLKDCEVPGCEWDN
jgi:hypothetical protein